MRASVKIRHASLSTIALATGCADRNHIRDKVKLIDLPQEAWHKRYQKYSKSSQGASSWKTRSAAELY
jgi:hypothetical protein